MLYMSDLPVVIPAVPAASAAAGASWAYLDSSFSVSSCWHEGVPCPPFQSYQGSCHLGPSVRAAAQTLPAGPAPACGSLHSLTASAWPEVQDSPAHRWASGRAAWTGPVLERAPAAALLPGSAADRGRKQKEAW